MKIIFRAWCLFFLLVCSIVNVEAKIGVGVGVGKIEVDEILVPGSIYDLPDIPVINSGDVETSYDIGIAYHEGQEEFKPEASWFVFSPKIIKIKPQEAKTVDMKLNLPLNTEPGLYFAYLEAKPVIENESGITRVGIAAATKLTFAVAPANLRMAVFYKVKSFFRVYAPWPQRAIWACIIIVLIVVFKKTFKLEINLKKKK